MGVDDVIRNTSIQNALSLQIFTCELDVSYKRVMKVIRELSEFTVELSNVDKIGFVNQS